MAGGAEQNTFPGRSPSRKHSASIHHEIRMVSGGRETQRGSLETFCLPRTRRCSTLSVKLLLSDMLYTSESTTPRACEGPLGPLDPGPSGQTSSSEVAGAVDSTPASAPPWQVVVSGSSLRAVIFHLLAQVSPRVRPVVKLSVIFQETQRLLLSSFPWVRVTVDSQQANSLLQPAAASQLAEYIKAQLEQVLVPWIGPEQVLLNAKHIFQHYAVFLVAFTIARIVPDHLEASRQDLLRLERALKSLPPGSMLTVSSDLVDDLLVRLMLKLHPLDREGLQKLLTVTLKISRLIQATVRMMPGITVDTSLPRPNWDIRMLSALIQCSLIKSFGTPLQGPDMLCSILREVVETLLALYHSDSPEDPSIPTQAPGVEQEMDENLLSRRTLPEPVGEQLSLKSGAWVRHSTLFCRAVPLTRGAEGDPRRAHPPVNGDALADGPVNDVVGAPQQPECPDAPGRCEERSLVEDDGCGPVVTGDPRPPPARPAAGDPDSVSTTDPQNPLLACSVVTTEVLQCPKTSVSLPDDLEGADECLHGEGEHSLTSPKDTVPIQRSTVGVIVAQLFRDRDQMSSQSHILRYQTFQKLVVQEVHLLLLKEATVYQNDPVFQRTLERLRDPGQEEKLALELRPGLQERLKEAFPGVCLSGDGLTEDPQDTLLACSLIATEVLEYLRTSVSRPGDVEGPEECLRGEHKQPAASPPDPQNPLLACSVVTTEVLQCPKTSVSLPDDLEGADECLHGEGEHSLTSPKETVEVKKKKKKKRWSWLRRLFSCTSKQNTDI